jgi:hypothetical protein
MGCIALLLMVVVEATSCRATGRNVRDISLINRDLHRIYPDRAKAMG